MTFRATFWRGGLCRPNGSAGHSAIAQPALAMAWSRDASRSTRFTANTPRPLNSSPSKAHEPMATTTSEPRTAWYRELTGYHWFVLSVSSLGWMFDTMAQQLFNL